MPILVNQPKVGGRDGAAAHHSAEGEGEQRLALTRVSLVAFLITLSIELVVVLEKQLDLLGERGPVLPVERC